MKITKTERVILAAIRKAQAQGFEIVRNSWGSRRAKRCCAIGALVVNEPQRRKVYAAAGILNKSHGWIHLLLAGFDGLPCIGDAQAHRIGRRLALRVFGDSK